MVVVRVTSTEYLLHAQGRAHMISVDPHTELYKARSSISIFCLQLRKLTNIHLIYGTGPKFCLEQRHGFSLGLVWPQLRALNQHMASPPMAHAGQQAST